jgi:hypothetical protein
MIEIKAPKRFETVYLTGKNLFLAGSIEMGKAELWQERVCQELKDYKVNIYNPRRDDWDSSWKQDILNKQFHEQVVWELDHIRLADLVIFYFDPKTTSPITLLELGLISGLKEKAIVCCPEGYFRKGNVDIVCSRFNIPIVETFKDLITYTKLFLEGKQ